MKYRQIHFFEKKEMFDKYGGRCAYCGIELTRNTGFTVDHIIPLISGGDDEPLNMNPCCYACNSNKSGNTLEQFKKRYKNKFENGFYYEANGKTNQ